MKIKIGIPAFVLAALLFLGMPLASSSAYVAVSVGIAPPAIPVYSQPLCPAAGYIWTPGYWAWGDFGYYWVPGTWVLPPGIGYLWTPGYWAFSGGNYLFYNGYWGPSVGFYGGINYGYGYYGSGYYGGRWAGNTFSYNTAASRVNPRVITNTYVNREVVRNSRGPRPSFNGRGGVQAKPTSQQLAAAKAPHVGPTSAQRSLVAAARNDPSLRSKNNKGRPTAAAVRTFENRHRPNAVERTAAKKNEHGANQAAAKNRSETKNRNTAENRAGAARKAGAEKSANRTNRIANRSHVPAKAARNEHVASAHSRKGAAERHNESRRVANTSHVVHHEHAASHHERVASHPQHTVSHHQRVVSHYQHAASHPRRAVSYQQPATSQHRAGATSENSRRRTKKHGGSG
ncbi:MAG: YXWGXW repeat-containing protein [Chthoniobacterales bacterium]